MKHMHIYLYTWSQHIRHVSGLMNLNAVLSHRVQVPEKFLNLVGPPPLPCCFFLWLSLMGKMVCYKSRCINKFSGTRTRWNTILLCHLSLLTHPIGGRESGLWKPGINALQFNSSNEINMLSISAEVKKKY